MRVAILGAGAMGALYGATLAAHGDDVLMVEVDGARLARYRDDGVTVARNGAPERTIPVAATADPASCGWGPAELAIVFVKSYATDPALALAAPLIGAGTAVLTLQNGWGNGEAVARHVPAERVLVGVSYHSASMPQAGRVEHTAVGTTYVGPHVASSAALAQTIAERLSRGGVATEVTPAIDERIWRKLVLNCAANPTGALTGLAAAQLIAEPSVSQLVRELAAEAAAVARARGLALAAEQAVADVFASLEAAGPAIASMRQDVEAGRRTEIETITGALLREADRLGIDVPANRTIHGLIAGYEAREGFR